MASLELLLGPMRSNKTEELLRRVAMRRTFAHQSVVILKPSDDTKSEPGFIESRSSNGHRKMEAFEFNSTDPWSALSIITAQEQLIGTRVDCIALDEAQFVEKLFSFTGVLLEKDYDIIVAGLDLNFRGLPFGDVMRLMWFTAAYGGSVTWCIAYCACGARAWFSQRLINGEPAPYENDLVVPGDSYEPRCRRHFALPGRPNPW
jgi:thymidine kinase